MSSNCQRGAEVPSSADCELSQDSDDDDISNEELWNSRPLQHQVGYLDLSGGFASSLSPQPSSSIECARRVSPLDPNLSSAARYSPPPPYSSSIDDINPSVNHPSSPLGDLANPNSLSNLSAAGVSSSISRHSNTIGYPSVSRSQNVSTSNSLFSDPPSTSVCTRPKWSAPRLIFSGEDFQSQIRPPAESIWAKQKRLTSAKILQFATSKPNDSSTDHFPHQCSSARRLSQAGSSGLQDPAIPGTSGIQRASQSDSSSLPKLVPGHKSSNICSESLQLNEGAASNAMENLSYFEESGLESSPRPGTSGTVSNSLEDVMLPHHSLSKIKSISQSMLSKSADSNSSDDEDEPSELLGHADALVSIVSGCEASSHSVRNRLSPLRSPCTPQDNCIVSSSTGHIDSIPPTPVEFQGNDVSEPSSPVSPTLACSAIIDSTVDSTSGRGIMDSVDTSSDDDSDEDLVASDGLPLPDIADEGGEISTSEAVLQNSDDDSQDVGLLVSPQGMFSSERTSDSRFIEQLSLSLSQFPSNSLDASLSVSSERCDSNMPPNSNSISYLDDALAIPGPSRMSLAELQANASGEQNMDRSAATTRQNIGDHRGTLRNSLPLMDITVGLSAACSSIQDAEILTSKKPQTNSSVASLVNIKESNVVSDNTANTSMRHCINPLNNNHDHHLHHPSYALPLHDGNSFSSDPLAASSLGKDTLPTESISVKREGGETSTKHEKAYYNTEKAILCNVTEESPHSLLSPDHIVSRSLDGSLDLNLESSSIAVSVALPVSSQQHMLTHQLLQSQPDQVSLLVGGEEESSNGALLMMVSSDNQSLSNTLSIEKRTDRQEGCNSISAITNSEALILSSENVDEDLENISFEKDDVSFENASKGTVGEEKNVGNYVDAKFWCGDCGKLYKTECSQHAIRRKTERNIKSKQYNLLPSVNGIDMERATDVE
ncbi:hypothetical protein SK128_019178, partial [Halocaridina rubra]